MEYEYKIQEKVDKKINTVSDLQSEIYDYMQNIGKAHTLAIISFMLDENFDEKDIRKHMSDMINQLNQDALVYFTEVKSKCYSQMKA